MLRIRGPCSPEQCRVPAAGIANRTHPLSPSVLNKTRFAASSLVLPGGASTASLTKRMALRILWLWDSGRLPAGLDGSGDPRPQPPAAAGTYLRAAGRSRAAQGGLELLCLNKARPVLPTRTLKGDRTWRPREGGKGHLSFLCGISKEEAPRRPGDKGPRGLMENPHLIINAQY